MQITLDHQGHRPLRVVQLTDSHLGADDTAELLGMNTDNSLDLVLDMLQQRSDQFDVILVTGDIALHGAREAYERFQNKLARFEQATLWLAGNHDDSAFMRDVVGFGNEMARSALVAGWQLIMLDSVQPNEVGGSLSQSELNFLRHCLQQQPDLPALVALHHHPMAVGCEWLDEQQISNSEEFLDLVRSHANVKVVCWGHVHQIFDTTSAGVRFMSSPSTCVQFAQNSADFKLDPAAPGVRWMELHADGHVDTEIWRLSGVNLNVDLESTGYAQD